MVSVNIENKIWIPFLVQSVEMRISASERIREFIKGELKIKKGEEK
jgi:hypothetical protein